MADVRVTELARDRQYEASAWSVGSGWNTCGTLEITRRDPGIGPEDESQVFVLRMGAYDSLVSRPHDGGEDIHIDLLKWNRGGKCDDCDYGYVEYVPVHVINGDGGSAP